ncbi:MAG: hypothetical protein COV91_02935 [Candidatus Taylorbacteria bacterium CG11_big_fil_rev_8_21_14_0_20_46_11]|uniref:Uncharacterized protein n=1 Tax=Candidatus Taylorbacteria bacterium CG11_big_fil_rev_8_21_14_0_20_46_11 TaxID=1975025 RepID=A0A2H0KBN5_9BACT|nr:MAG: hypothetical protein COV91_02935 [Candidatus Taylorbacteria bacterium CG11_big_fil_rev_8_21_14_0_20_46_11]
MVQTTKNSVLLIVMKKESIPVTLHTFSDASPRNTTRPRILFLTFVFTAFSFCIFFLVALNIITVATAKIILVTTFGLLFLVFAFVEYGTRAFRKNTTFDQTDLGSLHNDNLENEAGRVLAEVMSQITADMDRIETEYLPDDRTLISNRVHSSGLTSSLKVSRHTITLELSCSREAEAVAEIIRDTVRNSIESELARDNVNIKTTITVR